MEVGTRTRRYRECVAGLSIRGLRLWPRRASNFCPPSHPPPLDIPRLRRNKSSFPGGLRDIDNLPPVIRCGFRGSTDTLASYGSSSCLVLSANVRRTHDQCHDGSLASVLIERRTATKKQTRQILRSRLSTFFCCVFCCIDRATSFTELLLFQVEEQSVF